MQFSTFNRMKRILLFFLLTVTLQTSAQNWKAFPAQGGGLNNQLVFDTQDSATLYLASSLAGLFKTTDMGEYWINLFNSLPVISSVEYYCRDVAINPQNHNEIFVVCGAAPYNDTAKGILFHSTDAGVTWQRLNCPVSISATSSYSNAGHVILFNPVNTQQLFLAGQPEFDFNTTTNYYTTSGLYISNDGGQNWNSVADSLKTFWITGMKINPANSNELFFSSRDIVIYNSHTASGLYKYNITTGIVTKVFNQDVTDFAFDATIPNMILTVNAHLNISTDGGSTWSQDISPLYRYTNYFITTHPTDPCHWYIGGENGNYYSIIETINCGASWREADYKHNPNKQSLSFTDASCDYEPEFARGVSGIIFSPFNPKLAFLTDDHGVWKTYNADTMLCGSDIPYSCAQWKWKYCGHGIQNLEGRKIIVNKGNGKTFFASTDPALFVSDDGGNSCSYLPLPDAECDQVSSIAFYKNNPQTGYLGGSRYYDGDGKFFKTTDGGVTWQQLAYNYFDRDSNDIQNVTQIAISDFSADTVVAGTDSRNNQSQIHISYDGGVTWHDWSQGVTLNNLFPIWETQQKLFTDGSGYFFICKNNHLFRRKTTDAAWTEITGPGSGNWWYSDAKPDPVTPGKIYASFYSDKLYYSFNHGDTWSDTTTTVTCIYRFAVSDNGMLGFIQCADGANNIGEKFFASLDGGATCIELPLNGFIGWQDNLLFTGGYTLAAISENTGAFMFDLNQVGVRSLADAHAVTVFPNPAAVDQPLTIHNADKLQRVTVYDLNGKKLFEAFNPSSQINPLLQAGVYFVQLVSEKNFSVEKLVVQ